MDRYERIVGPLFSLLFLSSTIIVIFFMVPILEVYHTSSLQGVCVYYVMLL